MTPRKLRLNTKLGLFVSRDSAPVAQLDRRLADSFLQFYFCAHVWAYTVEGVGQLPAVAVREFVGRGGQREGRSESKDFMFHLLS